MTKIINPRKLRGAVAIRADAGGDLNKTLEALAKGFEDFKAANDERITGIKAKFDDVVTNEKVDKINANISDLKESAEKAIAEAKAAQSRMDELEKVSERIKAGGDPKADRDFKADAQVFHAGRKGVESVEVGDSRVDEYKAYSEAFGSFLRMHPDAMTQEVKAAMQVGNDPDGGYWVPTQMANDIKTRIFETSPMRQNASLITITTDSIKFPTDTNDGTSGGWVGETASRSVTATPQIGEQEIYVREQYAMPKVTQKLLDMATIDVESWLNGKIADKMTRTENAAFVTGTGVNQPRGFMDYKSAAVTTDDASRSWGVLQYIVTGASAAFPALSGITGAGDTTSLITTIAKLNPAYRAGSSWYMNRATEAAVRKLTDADGRYLVGMGDIRDGALGFTLFGYPIVNFEDMADIGADSFSIAFGNMSVGYQVVDGRGIRILRDPYTDKPYVLFYTTKWTGGDVVNFDAIKLVKFGTS